MSNLTHRTSVPNFNVSTLKSGNSQELSDAQLTMFSDELPQKKKKKSKVKSVSFYYRHGNRGNVAIFHRSNGSSKVHFPTAGSANRLYDLILGMVNKDSIDFAMPVSPPDMGCIWAVKRG